LRQAGIQRPAAVSASSPAPPAAALWTPVSTGMTEMRLGGYAQCVILGA
jgi:hypothetical protein